MVIIPLVSIIIQAFISNPIYSNTLIFSGLSSFLSMFSDPSFRTVPLNTIAFVLGVTITSVVLAAVLALILTRTDLPYSQAFEAAILSVALASPLAVALGWVYLAGAGGYLSYYWSILTGFPPPWNITNLASTIMINALYVTPIAYLIISTALKSMDPSYEEACRISGASYTSTIRLVTLPMVKNAFLFCFTLVALTALEQFSIPLILAAPSGTYILTTYINYLYQNSPPQLSEMASIGLITIILTTAMLVAQRKFLGRQEQYVSITGKFTGAKRLRLSRKFKLLAGVFVGGYILIGVPLPIFGVLYRSVTTAFLPFENQLKLLTLSNLEYVLNDSYIRGSIVNTIEISSIAATLGILFTVALAYFIYRGESRGSVVLDYLSSIPMGIPGIVIGMGFLFGWSRIPIPIYGTIWIIVIAYITRFIPLGMRTVAVGVTQVNRELEEACRICGGSEFYTFRRILFPLVRPAIVAGWLLLFITFVYELGTSWLLFSYGSQVSSVVMVQLFGGGGPGPLAALATVQFIVVVAVYLLMRSLLKTRLAQ
jgi:iron(III) transport system permease protein